jgi:hypothetical protein
LQALSAEEKARALKALSFAKQHELIQQSLDFSLAPEVRAQDSAGLITHVAARGGPSLTAAWAFVREYVSHVTCDFFSFFRERRLTHTKPCREKFRLVLFCGVQIHV